MVQKNTWLSKTLVFVAWAISAVVFIFIVIGFSFVFYFNQKIRIGLQNEFLKQTNGEYTLEIDKLQVNVFVQSISVSGISIVPVKGIKPTATKYYFYSTNISLKDFSLRAFLFYGNLRFNSLELLAPKAIIFRNKVDGTKQNTTANKFGFYNLIKPYANELNVKKIQLINSPIKVYATDKDSLLIIDSKKNELTIIDFAINSVSQQAGSIFQAKKIELTVADFSYTTKDSL